VYNALASGFDASTGVICTSSSGLCALVDASSGMLGASAATSGTVGSVERVPKVVGASVAFRVSVEAFGGSMGVLPADTAVEAEFRRAAVWRNVRTVDDVGDPNRRRQWLVGRTVGCILAPHAAAKVARSLVEQTAHRCGLAIGWLYVGELRAAELFVEQRKKRGCSQAKPRECPLLDSRYIAPSQSAT
jgi:hypothetical protein